MDYTFTCNECGDVSFGESDALKHFHKYGHDRFTFSHLGREVQMTAQTIAEEMDIEGYVFPESNDPQDQEPDVIQRFPSDPYFGSRVVLDRQGKQVRVWADGRIGF